MSFIIVPNGGIVYIYKAYGQRNWIDMMRFSSSRVLFLNSLMGATKFIPLYSNLIVQRYRLYTKWKGIATTND
jgi:hypothetical protein